MNVVRLWFTRYESIADCIGRKRPIGTPCALNEHEMNFFRRRTIFAALKCFETIWNEKRKRRHRSRSRSRSWESCLHYLIRQLVCEQIPAIEHTITFLSSHSRPLTHFSFSAASSTNRVFNLCKKKYEQLKSEFTECENVWRIDEFETLFLGQEFI